METAWPADRFEIVLALDRTTAVTDLQGIEGTGQNIRIVSADGPGGKAAAINAGVRAARGEIVVFADTFQRFEVNTIPDLLSVLEDPGVGAVTGNLMVASTSHPLLRHYWTFREMAAKDGSTRAFFGGRNRCRLCYPTFALD